MLRAAGGTVAGKGRHLIGRFTTYRDMKLVGRTSTSTVSECAAVLAPIVVRAVLARSAEIRSHAASVACAASRRRLLELDAHLLAEWRRR